MTFSSYPLAILLLLMPMVAVIDGLAMAPLAVALFLLLAWPQRRALADWRSIYRSHPQAIIILLLLTVWPVLTSLWSIVPQVSLMTALRSAALLLLALLGIFLAGRQDDKPDRTLCLLPAFGVALALLLVFSGQLPGGGSVPWVAALLKHDELTYLSRDINRGLCVLSVLVWPAVIGLLRAHNRKLAMVLPWVLLLALFSLHSLSAKTGLLAGMAVFYVMALWPRAGRRTFIWGAPLVFMALPLAFYLFEPILRASMFKDLPGSSQHRVEIWHFVLEKWKERPWLGWGVDSSRAIPGGLEEIMPGLVKLPLHPHNLPLHVLLEQGIIGFGLFFTALWLFVRRMLPVGPQHSPMISAAMAATLASYLTIAMSGFGMWQNWWEATGLAAFLIIVFVDYAREGET